MALSPTRARARGPDLNQINAREGWINRARKSAYRVECLSARETFLLFALARQKKFITTRAEEIYPKRPRVVRHRELELELDLQLIIKQNRANIAINIAVVVT